MLWHKGHSWQRDPNPRYFMKTPLYCLLLPPLQYFVHPLPPPPPPLFFVATNPHAVLFLFLNGWSRHILCSILLNDIMNLHVPSLGIFVSDGPWCVFYATRCQVYWGLPHEVVFCWYSDLISHTYTNTYSTLRSH